MLKSVAAAVIRHASRRLAARVAWLGLLAAPLAALVGSIGGCGSGERLVAAGGRVTFVDGSPLGAGFVSFRPLGGRGTARGEIRPDGSFCLTTRQPGDGALAGEYQALISPALATTPSAPGQRSKPRPPIDFKFMNFDTSGLRFTIGPDPAANDFKIQVSPPAPSLPSGL